MTGQKKGCYHGGAFFDVIGNEFGSLERRNDVINADVLDAWFPPAPSITELLTKHLDWIIRTSPPTGCEGMIRAVARARGVEEACILPGSGSSDLMFLALRQWLTPGSRTLVLEPTYGEYEHILKNIVGCRVERLACRKDEGFGLNPEQLRDELRKGFDLCVLVNPNSPTGHHVPREVLSDVLAEAPESTTVWIDETYVEYAGADQSLEQFATQQPNIVVSKSMSKAYALSGLRVAYLCAAAGRIAELKKYSPPWVVGLPGQIAAVMALRETAYYQERYRQTREFRAELVAGLQQFPNLEIVPGIANFILCMLDPQGPTAATVVQRCREQNLYLRDAGSMGGVLGDHALRLAVKDRETNLKMLAVLDDVLGGIGLPL